jgi:CHAT domain-containing protein/tetratricopeptide (TPR) repeat protein
MDDLYRYVAVPSGKGSTSDLEPHLASCPRCREELAEVLKLLHPESQDPSDAAVPPSEAEIAQTMALIQDVARKEKEKRERSPWTRWVAAAAAAIALVGAGAGGFKYYSISRSNQYLALAKANLEEVYAARSPDGLRLDLPFRSAATSRAAGDDSPLKRAEILFSQALVGREDMPEPHLGLAAIYLSESQFARARDEFQKVLAVRENHPQALLGRGVAEYEAAKQAADPIQRRNLLSGALADFDNVLKQQPCSPEASYNRIWVLYETGQHTEALAEIDSYLSRDPDSIWAAKLRDLQTQIRLIKADAVREEVDRTARNRNAGALTSMARLVPEQVPPAIRSALKRSLQLEGSPARLGEPTSADLRWAAETMEAAYSATVGDHSWKALLTFYAGLSPPERQAKRSLDGRFQKIVDLHLAGKLAPALRGSESLEPQFSRIQDYWQLFNIHFLRGNCHYYQADFQHAEAEYREMLRLADLTGAPEFRAKALAALISAYNMLMRPDDAARCITELASVAKSYHMDSWEASVAQYLGTFHRRLNQFGESLSDYTVALSFAYRNRDEGCLARVLEALFPVMIRLGRLEDGKSLYSEAVERMADYVKAAGETHKIEVNVSYLNLLCRQGEIALQTRDLDQAEASFKMGLAGPPHNMPELECRMRIGLAEVCLGKKRFEEARALLDEGLSLASTGKYDELEWQASLLQGRMHKESGNAAAALITFQRSVDALERMRGGIKSEDLKQQFLTRRFDPYKEIVSLLYHAFGDGKKAWEFAGRAKSMTLREYLDGSGPTLAGQSEADAQTVRALSVDYFFGADELLAFVSGSNGSKVVELRSSPAEIGRDVKKYLESIRTGDEATFAALSRKLYDGIVEPILETDKNEQYGNLLIFPDGPLHLLPFGGLKDSEGRFLLEKHTLSYAPSRSVLHHCLSLGRAGAGSRSRTVLLVDGAANLPFAGDEVACLSKIYGRNSHFLAAGDLASAGRLAADAEIFHFAGHSTLVNGKPALMLESAPHQAYLDSKTISSWHLRKNGLVTLAGCETGIGPQAEGEIPWGLIPAFLNAGAPALIVSLLPVDDASTARLTSRFYELLANGSISKASALQQAQLSLLSSARAGGRLNPASWLPYVLIGDPR